DVIVTYLDNTTKNYTLTYNIIKGTTLSANATTIGFEEKVNDTVVYTFNDDIIITFNKIDITNIVLSGTGTFTFDGNIKGVSVASSSVLSGDDVGFVFAYNGNSEAVNVGNYDITVVSLTGNDAIFYNIPSQVLGQITINKLAVKFNVTSAELTYNGESQGLVYEVVSTSDYVISASEYEIKYIGATYESNVEPTNAGTYSINLILSDNFKIDSSSSLSYTFNILQKEITNIKLENTKFTYNGNKVVLGFVIDESCGKVENDTINVTEYLVYNQSGASVDAVNVGTYSVKVLTIDNDNYKVNENVFATFEIGKANITISIDNASSTYGDEIDLSSVAYVVTSGEIYGQDELNVQIVKAEGLTVADYDLTLVYDNANYNVSVISGKYTISKRDVSITFSDVELRYNGQNQSSKINAPVVNNIVSLDGDKFSFQILQNGVETTAQNAGNYTVSLIENDYINANYNITSEIEKEYTIEKANLNIMMQDFTGNFKQNITVNELTYTINGNYEDISNIVQINPYVVVNGENVTIINDLNVGTYVIGANWDDLGLASNYEINVINATLTIEEKQTYISANNINAIYTGTQVNFVAQMMTGENEVLSNAQITYVIKCGDEVVSEMINAGSYVVEVRGDAGENYEIATGTYTVNIAQNAVSVEFGDSQVGYNKTAQLPTINVSAQQNVDVSNLYSVQIKQNGEIVDFAINAGTYNVAIILSDNGNFKFATDNSAEFVIMPEKLSVTIGNISSKYGEEIDLSNVQTTITSGTLYSGDDLQIVLSKESGESANSYAITATYDNANYDVEFTNGVYTIEKQIVDIEAKENNEYIYISGLTYQQFNANYDYSLLQPIDELNGIVTYYYVDANKLEVQSVQSAGTYYLRVQLVDFKNYKFADCDDDYKYIEFVIEKQVIDLQIVVSDKIYDGQSISSPNVMVGNVSLDNDLYSVVYMQDETVLANAPKNVGNYIVKIVENDSVNYEFTNNVATFTIGQKVITSSLENAEVYYNRVAQKPNVVMNGKVEGDDVEFIINYNDATFINALTYHIEVTGIEGGDSANYKFDATEYDYTIKKINVNVVVGNAQITYLGRQLTEADLNLSFESENLEIISGDYALSNLPINVGGYVIDLT
ncbi:MAG: hypothetical protein ACI4TX_01065, partial [Christensenellales bacterium]